MIRERLQRVVDVVFRGNSHAASQAMEVEPSTLHRILEGRVSEARISTVRRLANALGIPVSWLLGELTSQVAQTSKPLLPEPVWLIWSFHRAHQRKARTALAQAPAAKRKGSRAAQLREFRFSPFEKEFPIPVLTDLITTGDSPTAEELEMVRRCAEFESAVVELAASKLLK